MQKSSVTKEDAYKLLGITPPFTEQQLVTAFRAAALKNHPDTGGDKDSFVKVYESRELLMPDAGKDREVKAIDGKIFTVDGVRISELGKGLKVSGKKCPECMGNGYVNMPYYYPCTCGGILARYLSLGVTHKPCNGTGYLKGDTRLFKCDKCQGFGELPNFNGLFGRGSLMQNGNLSQKERKGR